MVLYHIFIEKNSSQCYVNRMGRSGEYNFGIAKAPLSPEALRALELARNAEKTRGTRRVTISMRPANHWVLTISPFSAEEPKKEAIAYPALLAGDRKMVDEVRQKAVIVLMNAIHFPTTAPGERVVTPHPILSAGMGVRGGLHLLNDLEFTQYNVTQVYPDTYSVEHLVVSGYTSFQKWVGIAEQVTVENISSGRAIALMSVEGSDFWQIPA